MARQEVGEFMEQGPLHLVMGDFLQAGVQPDLIPCQHRDPGRRAHPGIPPCGDAFSKGGIDAGEGFPDLLLQ